MSLFSAVAADAILVNRLDPEELLGTFSAHRFFLDDQEWPTVEHYFQATKFTGELKERIRNAATPSEARKIGTRPLRRVRSDWKKVETTVLTRAVYIKCRTHSEVADRLIETAPLALAENTFGDYHWGIGRDGRGKNLYGKILFNVRTRLVEDIESASK